MIKGAKVFIWLMVSASIIMTCVSVFAQDIKDENAAAPLALKASGDVVSVDLEKAVLVIKQVKDLTAEVPGEIALAINEATMLTVGENVITLSDIKIGDKISAEYSIDVEGRNIVSFLTVELPKN